MIQRVQTLWMVLAAIAVFLTLKFSFYNGILLSDNTYHPLIATDHFLLMVLTSALGTAILINIFLYKHRPLQLRICILGILVECGIIFTYISKIKEYANGTYTLWVIFHFAVIVTLIMAAMGIYKDQKLVKDSNRLR